MIKERILKWGDYPTLAEQAQYNHLGFMRGKQENHSIVGVRMQARGWSDASKESERIQAASRS